MAEQGFFLPLPVGGADAAVAAKAEVGASAAAVLEAPGPEAAGLEADRGIAAGERPSEGPQEMQA